MAGLGMAYSYDRRTAATTMWLSGGKRQAVLDAVWAMYETSYAKIGMHIPGPQGLMKYDKWQVFSSKDGPIAFNLWKTTSFGVKLGLIGSDGSGEAKGVIKAHLKSDFQSGNQYGEVSHAVERLSQGAPVVCAVNVSGVLNKAVAPLKDGVHYKRVLKGIGMVTKKLVGNPKGGFSRSENACPVPLAPGELMAPQDPILIAMEDEEDDWMAVMEHLCCQCMD